MVRVCLSTFYLSVSCLSTLPPCNKAGILICAGCMWHQLAGQDSAAVWATNSSQVPHHIAHARLEQMHWACSFQKTEDCLGDSPEKLLRPAQPGFDVQHLLQVGEDHHRPLPWRIRKLHQVHGVSSNACALPSNYGCCNHTAAPSVVQHRAKPLLLHIRSDALHLMHMTTVPPDTIGNSTEAERATVMVHDIEQSLACTRPIQQHR